MLYAITSQRQEDDAVHRAALRALWRLLLGGGAGARDRAHGLRATRAVCSVLLSRRPACGRDVVSLACRALLELLVPGHGCVDCQHTKRREEPEVSELLAALPGILQCSHQASAHVGALQLVKALAGCRFHAAATGVAVACVPITLRRFPEQADAQRAACEAFCVLTLLQYKEARPPPQLLRPPPDRMR